MNWWQYGSTFSSHGGAIGCFSLIQGTINNIVKRMAFYEYAFLRLWSRALLGKKRRDELVHSERFNSDCLMLRHLMNRSTGFIKPLNKKEGFILYNGFHCVVPLDSIQIPEEVRRVYAKPKRGDVVIDVGAHYGFYTLYASRLVGDGGMILSFEPHPENYSRLLKNLRMSNVKNVKTFRTALGEFEGYAKLYVGSHSGGHSISFIGKKYIQVELTRLDTIIERLGLKRVDLIKIDAEGAELNVLKGAINVIERFKPSLTIAAYHFPDEITKLAELLKRGNPAYLIRITRNNFLHAACR